VHYVFVLVFGLRSTAVNSMVAAGLGAGHIRIRCVTTWNAAHPAYGGNATSQERGYHDHRIEQQPVVTPKRWRNERPVPNNTWIGPRRFSCQFYCGIGLGTGGLGGEFVADGVGKAGNRITVEIQPGIKQHELASSSR